MTDSPAPPPVTPPVTPPSEAPSVEGPVVEAPRSGRRRWLAWTARGLYAACAAAVAWPATKFFTAPLSAAPAGPVRDRAVKLSDLAPGVPKLVPITGEAVDAWTRHPAVTVGRAWVVRNAASNVAPADLNPAAGDVTAFSSVCPHAGCQVSGTVPAANGADTAGLLCPCHGAVFALDGAPRPTLDGRRNPSSRGLDALPCELVEDDDGDWWVQIEYTRFRPGTAEQIKI